ncbi:MAG: molybdopterin-dependent oxidoreductase [Pseudomonadota bacterium]
MTGVQKRITASHWGVGIASIENGHVAQVDGHPSDPAPSMINGNIAGSLQGRARVLRPAIRKSWLTGTPKSVARGQDSYVEVSWDRTLELIANELRRVRTEHGNEGIFAGSYGWASAGRFHHAQSQLKRFLNTIGGFVRSSGNYSYNAAKGLMPHIVGTFNDHVAQATRWTVTAEHADLVVLFGGLALRNTQVSDGGVTTHRTEDNLSACANNRVKFVNISPLRSDALDALNADWMPPVPGTDTALMMGLAHTILVEELHDQDFLARYTVGFDKVSAYLLGTSDGQAKDPEWAARITGIDADRIRGLARRMAAGRTMISVTAGVQRGDYGEQPMWMAVTLAAMLGQIGLPGGGYTVGYGVNANIGNVERLFRWGAFPQGENPVDRYIPVAMISDMLLNPGGTYSFQGQTRPFPDARLVWWAGGNPFHHHQDLNRLHDAFQSPETIIVNEINWTATARHADIVLPVAATQERTDFCAGKSDDGLVPMPQLVGAPGEARIEYEIYAELAERLGVEDAFTEGKTIDDWLHQLWGETVQRGAEHGVTLPDWETFIASDDIARVPDPSPNQVFLSDFRKNPDAHPLPTPSGKIELFSEVIDRFDLPDCKGHPTWFPPRDRADGKYPLALLSGQPATRLHSQLDNGAVSLSNKIQGREPMLIHPKDATARGIKDGDIVELQNDRGRCLAGARVTDNILEGCVFLWTGAWYDPDYSAEQNRDRHGNPNALTHDLRTSSLTQSPAAHSAMIEVHRFDGSPPPITVFDPPKLEPEVT